MSTRAAYLRPGTITGWTPADLRRWARRAVAAGIDTAVSKTSALSGEVVAELRGHGLRVVGSFTVFADHHDRTAPACLRPVDERGRVVEQVEWYRGIVPGDPAFLARRCGELAHDLTNRLIEGVVLDFVRWPGHWELDERPGAARSAHTSYDPLPLALFDHWLRAGGQGAGTFWSGDPAAAAVIIDKVHRDDWTRFRCETVTAALASPVDVVRAAGLWAGAFIVPATSSRRTCVYGQDVAAISGVVDYLWIMGYQAIVHQDPGWPARIASEVSVGASVPVVAMMQTTAERTLSGGANWGLSLTDEDVGTALRTLMNAQAAGTVAGTCLFPGEVLPLDQTETVESHHLSNGALP